MLLMSYFTVSGLLSCAPLSSCYFMASLGKNKMFVVPLSRFSATSKGLLYFCSWSVTWPMPWSFSLFGRHALRRNYQVVLFCFLMMPPAVLFKHFFLMFSSLWILWAPWITCEIFTPLPFLCTLLQGHLLDHVCRVFYFKPCPTILSEHKLIHVAETHLNTFKVNGMHPNLIWRVAARLWIISASKHFGFSFLIHL